MDYTYEYPHPAVATDIAIFTVMHDRLKLVLIKRGGKPYAGRWALPGGFLLEDEDLDQCAQRELREETGVEEQYLQHFSNFSAPGRDPRGWVVSVAYLALISSTDVELHADTDAAEARWFPVDDLPKLAFDHDMIVCRAIEALRELVEQRAEIVLALLPTEFTLTEMQTVCEVILGEKLHARSAVAQLGQEAHGVQLEHLPVAVGEETLCRRRGFPVPNRNTVTILRFHAVTCFPIRNTVIHCYG